MGLPAIDVHDVSKAYRIYPTPRHRLLEALTFGRRTYHRNFWALNGVTVAVEPGTTLGVVGNNGSGKSTLLQLMAGITSATSGRVTVRGRISSLLELGAGFNPHFTGRENVELYGIVMGLSRAEAQSRFPRVADFAGIGEFIDQPVRSYSSGMFVRLAFASAIHVDPDVLLVDEALAVGDAAFQHQCITRIREMQEHGTTIVFVSHDMAMIQSVCTRALLLHAGRVEALDDPATIANLYHARVAGGEQASIGTRGPRVSAAGDAVRFEVETGFDERVRLFRHGTGAARIRQVELLDIEGHRLVAVAFDQEVLLRVHVQFHEDAPFSILGFGFRDKAGTDIVGTNTHEEHVDLPPRRAGETLVVEFRLHLPLAHGSYSVSTALAYDRTRPEYFDWVDNAMVFSVLPPRSGKAVHGKVWLPVDITVHPS
jgi:ABC-type polysaccharide/polyol phosphate transport system ATPase subunit